MSISKRQQEEIEFLQRFRSFTATDDEIRDYISVTVFGRGKKTNDKMSGNRLRIAKTRWDLQLKTWLDDLCDGLLGYWELLDDPELQYPYAQRCIQSILARVATKPYYNGHLPSATLAFVNSLQNPDCPTKRR